MISPKTIILHLGPALFQQESQIYLGIHCQSPPIYYHGPCAMCYELQQENGPSTYIAILVKYKRKIELSNHKVWKCGNNFTLRNSMSGFCIEVFKTRGIPHPEITGILSLSRYHSPSTLCCTVRRQIQKYKNTKIQKYKYTSLSRHHSPFALLCTVKAIIALKCCDEVYLCRIAI